MFAILEPWGPGWAVRDARDGNLVRRGFGTREEADAWSSVTDRADLREFFYPSSVHWGEDYDERRGMKRIFARSAEEALDWAVSRQGATLTIENIFPKDR
jgi:dsDNA-binding SOS-regulon protein